MLEARLQRPACLELEIINTDDLLKGDSLAVRCRLMRALLPTVTKLPFFWMVPWIR